MKKVSNLYKKIIQSILALIGIGTLTACYGSPPPAGFVEGRIQYKTPEGKTQPVENIEVSFSTTGETYGQTFTDSAGSFLIPSMSYAQDPVTITCTDIDGEENGGVFNTKKISPKADEVFEKFHDITIEKE